MTIFLLGGILPPKHCLLFHAVNEVLTVHLMGTFDPVGPVYFFRGAISIQSIIMLPLNFSFNFQWISDKEERQYELLVYIFTETLRPKLFVHNWNSFIVFE